VTTAADVTVQLELSRTPVKVGEQVIFTCRVKGIQLETVVLFNKVVRVEGEISDLNKELIATLTVVSSLYKSRGFRMERTTEGSDVIYRLIIDGVKSDDGGSYSCSVPDSSKYSAKLLEVYRAPESVKFINYNESDVVELNETSVLDGLTCRVSHVMPHPDVTLTLGGRDVTDEFLVTAKTNILCSNIGVSSKTCPLHSDYDVEAVSRGLKLTYADNGMRLNCSSKMRVFEPELKSTSVILDVKHEPKVNCTSPLIIPVNQTAVRMQCTVLANPLVNSLVVTWFINKGKNTEIRLTSGDRTNEYAVEEHYDPSNPTRIDISLTIQPSFTEERYHLTYDVGATSSFGTQNTQIIVKMPSDGQNNGVKPLRSVDIWLSSTLLVLTSSSILLSRHV